MKALFVLPAICLWFTLAGAAAAASNAALQHNQAGANLLERGQPQAAITEFLRAIDLDAKFFPARLNLAYAYEKAERFPEAIEAYQEAIEAQPGNAVAHNNLGVLYDKQGLYQRAIAEFETALSIEPRNLLARRNLEVARKNQAIAEERSTRFKEVDEEARRKPHDPRALYAAARTHAFYGRKDAALGWLARAREEGFRDLEYLKVDPAFESLRNDPEFQRLAKP